MTLLAKLSRHVLHPLDDLREGSKRLKLLRGLESTQWLPLAELRALQWQRLRDIVAYAGTHSSYYRRVFAEAGFDPNNFDIAQFRALPLLSKADIRKSTEDMLSDEFPRGSLGSHKTGGSTGVSLTTYFDRQWLEVRTADAMRSNQWAGCFHGMTIAAIWGNPTPVTSLKGWLRSKLLDPAIVLDTMQINEASIARFVADWRRAKPEVLFGHSHSLYMLAKFLAEQKVTDLKPVGIISTSMMLLPSERAVIESVFGCKVTDRYGCEEVGLIGCECEQHRGMHLDIEHLFIEFLRADGTDAMPGEEGTIVLTDLLNKGMPFIRYRIEDVGVPSERVCPCGRGMPLMERVVGRVADYLKRPDGSLVAGVSLVERTLTAIDGLEQMQIVQPALHEIILNVVPAPNYDADSEQKLLAEFQSVFGPAVNIRVVKVAAIAQEASGKYRFSICRA
jgi:phenylacetate-CoA ligase